MLRFSAIGIRLRSQTRNFVIGLPKNASEKGIKGESERMKKFHEQLKLEKIPNVSPGLRFVDLVLVDTDPKNGELVANSEKNPTKWGDWQNNGRVTDF